jgi:hypothetical protein
VLSVTPSALGVAPSATQLFAAAAADQFGDALASAPAVTWSLSGGGSIDGAGLFTARSTAGGPFTLTASAGALRGTATVTVGEGVVDSMAPSVAFRSLTNGAVLHGAVKLEVLTSDNVGVTEVAWLLDGEQRGVVTSAPFDFVLQAASFPLGPHTLEAIARDAAGNTARTPAIEVTLVAQQPRSVLEGAVGCSSGAGSAPMAAACLMVLALGRRRRQGGAP